MSKAYLHLYRDDSVQLVLFIVTGGGLDGKEFTFGPQDFQRTVELEIGKNNSVAIGATVTKSKVGQHAVAIVEFDDAGNPTLDEETLKPGEGVRLEFSRDKPWTAKLRAVAHK